MRFYAKCFMFVFIFICFTYSYGFPFVNNQYVPADYVVMANKITKQVADKISANYNLESIGVTSGLADCVNVLGLSFQIKGPVTKEFLRKILVDCVEEFLTLINGNERLRPFLKNYPFTANEIEIAIFVVDERGESIYHPEIGVANEFKGTITYRTSEKDVLAGYKSKVVEDYDTALKIVKGNAKN